jgi:hypothetical protein
MRVCGQAILLCTYAYDLMEIFVLQCTCLEQWSFIFALQEKTVHGSIVIGSLL